MDVNSNCPQCHLQVLQIFYFCPNCGKNLRPKPLSISLGKQIGIYLLSFFLPPLGLLPGFKYLFQEEAKAKLVGVIALILTIISIFVTVNLAMSLSVQIQERITSQLNNQLDSQIQNIQPQLNQLPN